MPSPCSLCLEDLLAKDPDDRFLRCVALPGRQPGLRLHTDGSVGWRIDTNVACELMVSLDQKLLLLRPGNAPDVEVLRRGRHLLAPSDKPVVLLDGDEVRVAGRRFRVHIHGETTRVEPPTRLLGSARAATTVMALGAAMLSCNRSAPADPLPHPAPVASVQLPARTAEPVAAGKEPPTVGEPASSGSQTPPLASPSPPPSSAAPEPPSVPTPPTTKTPRKDPPIELRDMPPFAD